MFKALNFILLGLILLNAVLYYNLYLIFSEPELGVHFLAVGQGDAQLFRTGRSAILIDAGPGRRVIEEIDKVLPASDRTIDIAMISHPQLDHIGGMLAVLERYRVRLVLMTGIEYPLAEYGKLKEVLRASKIPILLAVAGEKIKIGDAQLIILYPEKLLAGELFSSKTVNETSIVAELVHPAISALFTGDITSKTEERLSLDKSEILKVPHHGSKYSSSEKFLAQVSPHWAVIEVGRNRYGHPSQETISRLTAIGARVLRTDVAGTVSFLVDGGVVKIKTGE